MKIESHDREQHDDERATGGICPVLHFHATDRIGQDEAEQRTRKKSRRAEAFTAFPSLRMRSEKFVPQRLCCGRAGETLLDLIDDFLSEVIFNKFRVAYAAKHSCI
jgi:hypothetical protein